MLIFLFLYVMQSVILNVIMLNVIMLSVVMLSVGVALIFPLNVM
jgi:hypothetical protein